MASASAEQRDLELCEVEIAVGPRSYDRGRAYARGGRVLKLAWDADAEALTGTVLGRGALYDTVAFFAATRGGELRFDEGECSCPVGYNCKHVAALVIAAADGRAAARPLRLVPAPATPTWERPLRAARRAGGGSRDAARDRAIAASERSRRPRATRPLARLT